MELHDRYRLFLMVDCNLEIDISDLAQLRNQRVAGAEHMFLDHNPEDFRLADQ